MICDNNWAYSDVDAEKISANLALDCYSGGAGAGGGCSFGAIYRHDFAPVECRKLLVILRALCCLNIVEGGGFSGTLFEHRVSACSRGVDRPTHLPTIGLDCFQIGDIAVGI